jgi:hypothetical protein
MAVKGELRPGSRTHTALALLIRADEEGRSVKISELTEKLGTDAKGATQAIFWLRHIDVPVDNDPEGGYRLGR